MGDYSAEKEFLDQLDSLGHGLNFCGHSSDILQLVWSLKTKVKEYFPMNEVPRHIIEQLKLLQERFEIAEQQLSITCDVISLAVEKNKKQ